MKKIIFGIGSVILIGTIIFLFQISGNIAIPNSQFLNNYRLNNLSVKQMVTQLDQKTDEEVGFYANITATTLTIGDSSQKMTFDVPDDSFYLSFAPYIKQTHPCGNHNLVTCRGELKAVTMHFLIVDSDGKTLINQNMTSMDNGFIGVWLPKNIEGTITVQYQGLSATSTIQTDSSSKTCLTTLKLS